MNETHTCIREGDITRIQTEIRTIFKRIDEQTEISKSVSEMAACVKVMATEMKNMDERMNDKMTGLTKTIESVETDVKELKVKPARRWDSLVQTAITAILSALIAFLVTRVGLR